MDTSRQTQAADTGLVYGKNAVAEILKSGRAADVVYIQEGMPEKQAAYYSALAREAGAVTKRIHAAKLAAMCGTQSHQGVAARAAQIEYVTLTNPDTVTVAESGLSLDTLFAGLARSFSAIVEYIS